MCHRPRAHWQGDEFCSVSEAMAGSLCRYGDALMLPNRRYGPIQFEVWKVERAFKEQERARGKPSIAVRFAVGRRGPLRMEVT